MWSDAGFSGGRSRGRDALTGLIGRTQFIDLASRRIRDDVRSIVIVWFNLDDFKLYNRRFGFEKGNALLRDIAYLLTTIFKNGIVSRFSDDNFVVMTKWERLEDNIERVQKNLLRTHREAVLKLRAGVYFPSAKDPGKGSAGLACDRAKMACDSIRRDHSISVRIYQAGIGDDMAMSMRIVDALDDALENGDISVCYQPIVRILTGSVCETEALTRWDDHKVGRLSPAGFIPVLEEYRDIQKLDMGIVRRICSELGERLKSGKPVLPVSVNISRLDFELCDIFAEVNNIVEENEVPKELLNIEVTESVHGEDQNVLHLGIEKFRQNGYEVWMDDFGSGYSSLNVLKDYTFDTIKFDMKFLSNFSSSSYNSRYILTSNLSMTKQMGIRSLAEGVENEEQFAFLKSIGFDKAQGYLFGRGMSFDELFALSIPKEDFRDAAYYERLGQVEMVSQDTMNRVGHALADVRAISLLEYSEDEKKQGGRFSIIAYNDVCKDWFAPIKRVQVEDLLNTEGGAMRRQFVSVVTKLNEPGDEYLFYAFLLGRCIRFCLAYIALNPRTGTRAYRVSYGSVLNLPPGADITELKPYLKNTLGEIVDMRDGI